jgi:hypothetical protein
MAALNFSLTAYFILLQENIDDTSTSEIEGDRILPGIYIGSTL